MVLLINTLYHEECLNRDRADRRFSAEGGTSVTI